MTPTGVSAEIEIIAIYGNPFLSLNPTNPNSDKWWIPVPAITKTGDSGVPGGLR